MAVQALQAKEVDRIILTRPAVEAGERLGFLPGDLMAKVDPYLRPLWDALHDMVGTENAGKLLERGAVEVAPLAFMRGRTLNSELHHPGRGAEHHAGADEDVPHPHRVRVQGRRHRRHHAGRRGRRAQRARRARADPRRASTGSAWVHLTSRDVVRHRIVQDIVDAYERAHAGRADPLMPRRATRGSRQARPGRPARRASTPTDLPPHADDHRASGGRRPRARWRCSASTSRTTSRWSWPAGSTWPPPCCSTRACAARPSCRCCSSTRR